MFGRIFLKDDGVEDKLTSVTEKAEETESRIGSGFKKITGAALSLGGALVAGLGLKEVFGEAEESQQAMAQMDTVLKSTKDASGMTKQSLEELAESTGKVTTYSKTETEQAENLMLTFTRIGKDVFPGAIEASENMATAMHMDLNSAVLQVGKALGNLSLSSKGTIQGLTMLQREGVNFSDSEKAQIKVMLEHNDVAGAQKIVLQELQTEFGNSAKAAGDTFAGQLKILKNNLIDTNAEMLKGIMPTLTNFLKQINSFVESMGKITPATQKTIAAFAAIAVSIVPMLSGMNKVKSTFNTARGTFEKFQKSFDKGDTKIQKFGSSIKNLESKIGNLTGIKKLQSGFETLQIKGLYAFDALKNGVSSKLAPLGNSISKIFSKLPSGFTGAFSKITSALGMELPKINSVFKTAGGMMVSGLKSIMNIGLKAIAPAALIATVLMGLGLLQTAMGTKIDAICGQLIIKGPQMIRQFAAKLVAQVPQMIQAGTTLLMSFINVLIANAPALINAATAIITALVNGLATNLPRLIPEIVQLIQVILQAIIANLPTIIEAGLKIILALVQGISNNLPQIINAIVQVTVTIINTLSQHLPEIIELGVAILVAIIEGLARAIPQLIAALPTIVHAIWNGLKNVNWGQLGMAIIQGIGEGLKAAAGGLLDIVKSIGSDILKGFKAMFGIHSPSTVFRDEVGKWIPAGVGVGIEENADMATNSLSNMGKKMIDSIGQNKNNILNAAKGLSNMNFGMNVGMKLTPAMTGMGNYSGSAANSSTNNSNNSNNSSSRQPVILNFVLPSGKVLANYIIDDVNILQGKQIKILSRG